MRAFLSHSSANKSFVGDVFLQLGAAIAEYDEKTFSAGKFNTEAIRDAIGRSDLFVLFATRQSLNSSFVDYEIHIANELLASRRIRQILTFCIDDVRPSELPESLRLISAVRRTVSVGTAARLIRSILIELQISISQVPTPYLGREAITVDIKARLAAPDEYTPIAIAFSGMDGIGRRTLARHIIPDVYPAAPKVHPTIVLEPHFDAHDLYRGLLEALGGFSKSEIFEKNEKFEQSDLGSRYLIIADLLEIFNRNNEVIFIVDNGGALEEDGSFSVDLRGIFEQLRKRHKSLPYIILILFRTPPASVREKADVYYFRVDPIDAEHVKRLISLQIKQKGQISSDAEVSRLVDLTDGHPYNIQFLLRLLDSHSIQSLIEDPSDLIAFKRRRGDEFVARIELKQPHIQVLSVLRTLGPTSIELLSAAVSLAPEEIGLALRELEEFHCIERAGNICSINRPLRSAFDRSSLLRLSVEQVAKLHSEVISIYDSYKDDDQIGIEIISSAARAAVYLNKEDHALAAFLSPANSVYVARQFYDQRRYHDCARICATALNSHRLISDRAKLETLRLRCLSLARLGEEEEFRKAFSLLGEASSNEKAMKHFLEGFRLRIKGEPADAIAAFKKAYALNPRSFATMRELSHALMQIGEMEEARRFSEDALKIAQTNPYVIDQVLALRIAKHNKVTRDIIYAPDIEDLLTSLERYGDEEGRSFYAIRMADILRRANVLGEALDFAEKAIAQTPTLVPAHIIQTDILIKLKRLPAALKKIEQIGRMIEDRHSGEGRARLPDYLFLKASYLIENEELSDAISLLRTHEHRLKRRIPELKRRISFLLGSDNDRLNDEQREWLKKL